MRRWPRPDPKAGLEPSCLAWDRVLEVTKDFDRPERLQASFEILRLSGKDRLRTPDRNQRRPRRRARRKFGGLGLIEMRRKRCHDPLAVEDMRHSIAGSFGDQIGDGGDQAGKGFRMSNPAQ